MRPGHFFVALLLASAPITITTMAQAAKLASRLPVASDIRGAKIDMLFHGNYCGVGSRAGTAPVDALDAACKRHDACTPSGGIPSCACNARLQVESTAIAQDAHQPPELQFLASMTAAGAGLMICAPASSRARHVN
jgi:tRNA(fMet)-specific endonuclease VapC